MADFTSDQEIFDTLRDKLTTAVVADALDGLGAREQAMRADIRPLYPGAVVVGRAYTALFADVHKIMDDPFRGNFEMTEALKPGSVLVIAYNQSTRAAVWGDLLSYAAQVRGANGIVIDGCTRDTAEMIKMKFPTFVSGITNICPLGRSYVIDHGCPVRCGGALVNPGDIVYGDADGVVVIPKELVEKAIPAAFDIMEGENQFRIRLRKGEKVRDAFYEVFKAPEEKLK